MSLPRESNSRRFFRRHMLVALLVTTTFVLGWGKGNRLHAEDSRPNIVFLFADDLGWTDPACYGSKYYQTPHIDRLSREGLKFTNAYTNAPNCAPTRACLLSGRYTPRHGIYTVNTGARGLEKFRKMIPVENRTDLPLSEVTMADALGAAGYATGCFGKWHLGNRPESAPTKRGFDSSASRGSREQHPATDHLTNEAIRFIRDNVNRPFFAYVPYHAVHTPIRAPQKLIDKYKHKPSAGGHNDPVYAAMLEELDSGIGRILATLDELDLTKKTIVIFYSDNGGMGGYARAGVGGGTGRDITDNAPLHGGKGMLYEGGVRVPLLIRWPGVIAAGSQCDAPVISIDFYPTFLEIADSGPNPDHKLDGVSLLPLLKFSGRATLGRTTLFWHFPGYLQSDVSEGSWRTTPAGAIRRGDWKLIEFFETGRLELYNLRDDLSETKNLADSMPARAQALHTELAAWRKAVDAPMPQLKKAAIDANSGK